MSGTYMYSMREVGMDLSTSGPVSGPKGTVDKSRVDFYGAMGPLGLAYGAALWR